MWAPGAADRIAVTTPIRRSPLHRNFILAAAAAAALGVSAPAANAAFPGQNGPILFGQGFEDGAGIFTTSPTTSPSLLFEAERPRHARRRRHDRRRQAHRLQRGRLLDLDRQRRRQRQASA